MSMIDYLIKIKGIVYSLAAIGEPVSEQDQIMNLFAGPGAYYNAFVTTINTRDDRISLETVQSMLLSYEQRLEQQESIAEALMITVNYASSQNRAGGGKRYNGGRGQYLGQGSVFQNSNSCGRGRSGRNGQGRRNNNLN